MVESSGLLNRRRVISSTGGSNPPLSAISITYSQFWDLFRDFASGPERQFANPLLMQQNRTSPSNYRAPLLFQRGSQAPIHFLRGFFLHPGQNVTIDVESKPHL